MSVPRQPSIAPWKNWLNRSSWWISSRTCRWAKLWESAPINSFDARTVGANDYGKSANSDIIVITSGLPRKPGMSRDDLREANVEIARIVTEGVVKESPDAIIIMVANPLDVMAWVSWKVSGFPKNRVMGMAGILDSARFRSFIAEKLDVSAEDVQAMVLGGHGDSMVPLPSITTVGGIPLPQLMDAETIEALVDRTRKGGGEIVGLLKTGSAFYAPAAATAQMVKSIVRNKKRILPCAAYLDGEYGIDGTFVGVPCKLGTNGIEEIIEINLTDEELKALQHSADLVKEQLAMVEL